MKFKLEILVSIVAMITAVAAVVVAVLQTQMMNEELELQREHQKLSVKPSLYIYSRDATNDEGGTFAFQVINQGLGPAVIESLSIEYKNQPVLDWASLITSGTDGAVSIEGKNRNVEGITRTPFTAGMTLLPDKAMPLLSLETTQKNVVHLQQMELDTEVSMCFCSMYNECWVTSNNNLKPAPVESCPTS